VVGVYFETVDLLLRQATARRGREDITPYLVEARETVELFKAAELRDYFRDDCVDTALAKSTRLDVVAERGVGLPDPHAGSYRAAGEPPDRSQEHRGAGR